MGKPGNGRLLVVYMCAFLIAVASASVEDVFDIDEIMGRGLMASAPQGTEKFVVTIKSSLSKSQVEANAAAIKTALATDLLGGKVEASDITLTVADARRRLLAGSTISATVTTNAATVAALQTAYTANAASFQTKYASTYGVTSLSSNDAFKVAVALLAVAATTMMI